MVIYKEIAYDIFSFKVPKHRFSFQSIVFWTMAAIISINLGNDCLSEFSWKIT